jgi:hypothetical protein
MNYIVYHISSTQKLKSFGSETSARRSTTCANRNAGATEYAYATESVYRNKVVSKKKVKNLLTGKEIEIDSNTPLCCDPSSETYWSM